MVWFGLVGGESGRRGREIEREEHGEREKRFSFLGGETTERDQQLYTLSYFWGGLSNLSSEEGFGGGAGRGRERERRTRTAERRERESACSCELQALSFFSFLSFFPRFVFSFCFALFTFLFRCDRASHPPRFEILKFDQREVGRYLFFPCPRQRTKKSTVFFCLEKKERKSEKSLSLFSRLLNNHVLVLFFRRRLHLRTDSVHQQRAAAATAEQLLDDAHRGEVGGVY